MDGLITYDSFLHFGFCGSEFLQRSALLRWLAIGQCLAFARVPLSLWAFDMSNTGVTNNLLFQFQGPCFVKAVLVTLNGMEPSC